jgi:hypothetical protein
MRLFAKECLLPLRIQKYEALDRRLPQNHPIRATLLKEYNNRMAGYKGEKSLDFHLSMLPDERYLIFHNIRLPLGKYFFQIDILLLTTAFAFILEVKNRTGEYHFEKYLGQTTLKGERIKNPVLQARLQALKLSKWLQQHNVLDLPVHYLFVNSNENAKIRVEHGNEQILRYISNSEGLIEKITQIDNMNKKEKLTPKELRKLKRVILTSDTPENFDVLEHFHLTPYDIPTGVRCLDCLYLPMNYSSGKWICPHCKRRSKTAHVKAIQDYFLLIKPTISNAELRTFLKIDSPRSANTIFRKLGLPSTGMNKGRVYFFMEVKDHHSNQQ